MKYLISQTVFILFMCMPFSLAHAQSESVTLDHVSNSFDDTLILANELVVFNIRVTNPLGGLQYNGLTNGFKIYSPDGATWDHTTGIFRAEILALPWGLVESILHFDDSSGTFARTPGGGGATPGQLPAGCDASHSTGLPDDHQWPINPPASGGPQESAPESRPCDLP